MGLESISMESILLKFEYVLKSISMESILLKFE